MVAMEFRHLRTVVAVAHHRSFTKAGEELHLAQSAISQQIRRLEAELGIEIFRRTSRSVEVTEEGALIVAHAHRVLAEMDDLHNQLEELTGQVRGTVRIGGIYPFGEFDLYDVLADFRARYPAVVIHMVEDTQDEMLTKVRDDELDCAFASVDPDAIGPDFAATLLWEEEFVAAWRSTIRSPPRPTSRGSSSSSTTSSPTATTRRYGAASRRRSAGAASSPGMRSCAPR